MKVQDIIQNETITYGELGGDSEQVLQGLVNRLQNEGSHWADAPGARQIVKLEDTYGLKENGEIVAFASFSPKTINETDFYQLDIISNANQERGNFYRMLSLLWTIKEHINKPIIDYGAQSKWGVRFADAIAKTGRFDIKWYNIQTGETSTEHTFRDTKMTDWRIVVEHCEHGYQTFPRFALQEGRYAICAELFNE